MKSHIAERQPSLTPTQLAAAICNRIESYNRSKGRQFSRIRMGSSSILKAANRKAFTEVYLKELKEELIELGWYTVTFVAHSDFWFLNTDSWDRIVKLSLLGSSEPVASDQDDAS